MSTNRSPRPSQRAHRIAVSLVAALTCAGCGADGAAVSFSPPEDLLPTAEGLVQTSNVRATRPSSKDGPILVSEPVSGHVLALDHCDVKCEERVVAKDVGTPIRATLADLDGAGQAIPLIADIGALQAQDTVLGRVIAMDGGAAPRTILSGLGRTACAEAADLDGDGDIDVLACVFGSTRGELLWAERMPDGTYTKRTLDTLAGTVDAFAFDADGDGDLDVVAAISQETEEVRLYRNDGKGQFSTEVILQGGHPCRGISNIALVDLDRDGDTDILVTNGDDMDPECHREQITKLHGVAWLENDGSGRFAPHDILRTYGAYVVRAVDLDGDSDIDLVLANYAWDPAYEPESGWTSLLWLENDGDQRFLRHDIDDAPGAIITMDLVDVDGDGVTDIITGSMNGDTLVEGSRRLAWLRGKKAQK